MPPPSTLPAIQVMQPPAANRANLTPVQPAPGPVAQPAMLPVPRPAANPTPAPVVQPVVLPVPQPAANVNPVPVQPAPAGACVTRPGSACSHRGRADWSVPWRWGASLAAKTDEENSRSRIHRDEGAPTGEVAGVTRGRGQRRSA